MICWRLLADPFWLVYETTNGRIAIGLIHVLLLASRTDYLGKRNSNDARKLYSRLSAAEKSRQILEYLDD